MEKLCKTLLKEWCEALLRLQITDTGNPRLDGALLCPACGKIHGRCFEAMYPFLYLAEAESDKKWVDAAEKLFIWAEHTVSQDDGSFLNDIDSAWKGTTVFNVIQLADCLLFHEGVLSAQTKETWKQRLKKAAQFLYQIDLTNNNINYPLSHALALYESGLVLENEHYQRKAARLAQLAGTVLTENGLLLGEGIPRERISPRGCRSVDIGYNVEETLPSLALYAYLSGDQKLLGKVTESLTAHLSFMLENGAWDNSFGTRNYKWSYWGSRTTDGCGLGYLLLADQNPDFTLAAGKNLTLLKACTDNGLLAGGPHYRQAGQAACIHHTFTHAKVLAGILNRHLCRDIKKGACLPRQREETIRYYPEVESWIVMKRSMTATVTAYDWEHFPGGHAGGGTLTLFHHERAGTLLCAGMSRYTMKEPNNMQTPFAVRQECLALRIEAEADGILYSSLYEDRPRITIAADTFTVRGELKDIHHNQAPGNEKKYCFCYRFEENRLSVRAEFTDGVLICPVVSGRDEFVDMAGNGRAVKIKKQDGTVTVESAYELLLPYGTERIFNLIPGLQALRIQLNPQNGMAALSISIGLI